MNREEADKRRDEMAAEHPEATWVVTRGDEGFRLVKIGIPPVTGPTATEVVAEPRPNTPDSPPSPDKQIVNPNWGM